MSGSFLLDTSVIIAFFSGEPLVVDRFNAADEILLNSVEPLQGYPFGSDKSVTKRK
jgi:hypothetical protein